MVCVGQRAVNPALQLHNSAVPERVGVRYSPVNRGGRFSRNAATPSR